MIEGEDYDPNDQCHPQWRYVAMYDLNEYRQASFEWLGNKGAYTNSFSVFTFNFTSKYDQITFEIKSKKYGNFKFITICLFLELTLFSYRRDGGYLKIFD